MIQLDAGDGNRVWFSEMFEALRSEWNESMSFPRFIELCSSLDAMLQRRQPKREMLPPGVRCPACGRMVTADQQAHRISVRATILTLGRFGIAPPVVTKKMEKEWAKYRADYGLDLYGRPAAAVPAMQLADANESGCMHAT